MEHISSKRFELSIVASPARSYAVGYVCFRHPLPQRSDHVPVLHMTCTVEHGYSFQYEGT